MLLIHILTKSGYYINLKLEYFMLSLNTFHTVILQQKIKWTQVSLRLTEFCVFLINFASPQNLDLKDIRWCFASLEVV